MMDQLAAQLEACAAHLRGTASLLESRGQVEASRKLSNGPR